MKNSFEELTHLVDGNNYPQGQEEKTWLVYHQAIQQYQPNNAKAYRVLGDALHTFGNLEVAIQSYLEAVAIEPYFVDAYMSLGNVFAEQGRLAEAIAHYYQALAIQPNLAMGYWNLGSPYKLMEVLKIKVL